MHSRILAGSSGEASTGIWNVGKRVFSLKPRDSPRNPRKANSEMTAPRLRCDDAASARAASSTGVSISSVVLISAPSHHIIAASILAQCPPTSAPGIPNPRSGILSSVHLLPVRSISLSIAQAGRIFSLERAASFLWRSSKEQNALQPISRAAATCQMSAERARVAAACFAERASARR